MADLHSGGPRRGLGLLAYTTKVTSAWVGRPDLQRRATLRLGDSRSVSWAEWSKCCKIELMRPKWYRDMYGTSVTELVYYFCWRGTGFVMNRLFDLPISWANHGGKRWWYCGEWQATKQDKSRQDRLVIQKIKLTPFLIQNSKRLLELRELSSIPW